MTHPLRISDDDKAVYAFLMQHGKYNAAFAFHHNVGYDTERHDYLVMTRRDDDRWAEDAWEADWAEQLMYCDR